MGAVGTYPSRSCLERSHYDVIPFTLTDDRLGKYTPPNPKIAREIKGLSFLQIK